jgi:hypothetical protein
MLRCAHCLFEKIELSETQFRICVDIHMFTFNMSFTSTTFPTEPKKWPTPSLDCECRTCVSNRHIREQIRICQIMGVKCQLSESKITLCMLGSNRPIFEEYISWVSNQKK